MTPTAPSTPPLARLPSGFGRPLAFALLGLAMGLADLALLAWLDVQMTYSGADVRVPVVLLFAGTFALLGFAVGHLRDARARALADQALIQRQLLALRSEQARALENETLASVGRMAASVAHEVRNPLGVIRSSATVLTEELRDGHPDALQSCAFIRDEVERLDAFVSKLLSYARPNQLTPAPVEPRALMQRVLTVAHGVDSAVALDVRATSAELDEQLLLPALVNLVQNARHAAAQDVAVRVRAEAQGGLVIEVCDDGPGVGDEHRGRLFQPFFTTKRTGTGLGLAMARKLVRTHRGTLEYHADAGLGPQGEGACFRVTLPEARAA
jgi:two-component system sensor histidine kinase HydH